MWNVVAGVFLLSAVAVRFFRQVALKKVLLDIPNERSSHKRPVPRLGGAAFMPVVFLAVGLFAPLAGLPEPVLAAFIGGVIALYIISLTDDFITLSTTVRFGVQFGAAGSIVWAATHFTALGTVDFIGAWFPALPSLQCFTAYLSHGLLILWIIGALNIYNFMDGIDGIAGVQAVVAGLAWAISGTIFGAPFSAWVGAMAAAGALGFLTLNWPPAKIFMGDAGSTVLGYLFAALPLVAKIESKVAIAFDRLLIVAALLLWPFLSDGAFTILRRLRKGENILKAHRSHLYQRLVISGRSHAQVTGVYGGLATVGAFLAWGVVANLPFAVPVAILAVGVLFLALWRWVVWSEAAEMRKNAR